MKDPRKTFIDYPSYKKVKRLWLESMCHALKEIVVGTVSSVSENHFDISRSNLAQNVSFA